MINNLLTDTRSVSFLLFGIVRSQKKEHGRARAKYKVRDIFQNLYL